MNVKIAIIGLIFVLLVISSCANNRPEIVEKKLEHYPYHFITENEFNAVIIVDDNAPSKDIESAKLLQKEFENSEIKKYTSQIKDLSKQNAILIGSCSQVPQNTFANIYTDCVSMMQDQALIRIIDHNGVWLLYVIGYDEEKTANAVEVLINYKKYELVGQDVEVVKENNKLKVREPR